MFYGGRRSRTTFSVLIGIVCILLGGLPFLSQLGIKSVANIVTSLPMIFSPMIIKVALLLGGILLLYDGFQIRNPLTGMIRGTSIVGGLLLAIIGAVPLLIDLKLLNKYLPFIATLNINPLILQGLLVFFGFYLFYDAYILSRQFF